jgi:hypothetical protein
VHLSHKIPLNCGKNIENVIDIVFNYSTELLKELSFKEIALIILSFCHLLMEFKKNLYIGRCKNSPGVLKRNESRSGFFNYKKR